jgi:hypothetical protein
MIPITDIEDPRLVTPSWTTDRQTADEIARDFLEAPRRLAAVTQAIDELVDIETRAYLFRRAREILGE